jgi:hypothetical protein
VPPEISVLLVVAGQGAAGLQDLPVQALALDERPVLELVAVFQEEALQELAAIEADHFF